MKPQRNNLVVMRGESVLKLDSDLSKIIGFTADQFDFGTILNRFPKGVYISFLAPRNDNAITQMFDKIDEQKIKFRYCCPPTNIIELLQGRSYIMYYDTAGTPFLANCMPVKAVSAIFLPEDWLTQR